MWVFSHGDGCHCINGPELFSKTWNLMVLLELYLGHLFKYLQIHLIVIWFLFTFKDIHVGWGKVWKFYDKHESNVFGIGVHLIDVLNCLHFCFIGIITSLTSVFSITMEGSEMSDWHWSFFLTLTILTPKGMLVLQILELCLFYITCTKYHDGYVIRYQIKNYGVKAYFQDHFRDHAQNTTNPAISLVTSSLTSSLFWLVHQCESQ